MGLPLTSKNGHEQTERSTIELLFKRAITIFWNQHLSYPSLNNKDRIIDHEHLRAVSLTFFSILLRVVTFKYQIG